MRNDHPIPINEAYRLSVLDRLAILDTDEEETFDRITSLAADFFQAPMCFVSLIDRDRQWFKSRHGLDDTQTPRDEAFCAHAIMHDDLFIVEDARKDPRFADKALVVGPPHIRFYAGAPLLVSGARVGTLCIIDQKPRDGFDPDMQRRLRHFGDIVQDQLQTRLDAVDNERGLTADLELATDESRRTKERFLRLVSHELRTPLNAVIGFADLMSIKLERGQSVDVGTYASMISSGGRTLLTHVEHLLSITNLERGELQLNESDFVLGEVLDGSIQQLMAEAELRDQKINRMGSAEFGQMVNGDKGFLRQILMHVLSHAVSKGLPGTSIDVSARTGGRGTAINVDFASSSGIAETRNALKDPFETAVDSLFANDEGLGVVLYIARLLAEAHGGTVLAQEKDDRLIRLSIVLPAHRVSAIAIEAACA
ncbi:MAG: GAF domain-containing sensor histidine kinase [Minwuia sp.]|nr:GAF domain-containing sensor histidine kinase [Minwuia sp.]